MNIRLKRTPGLYLVGFMGCGKTTIGRLAAARLGWTFADLDDDIEAAEGIAISEIFAVRGEAEFRRIETEALRVRVCEIAAGRPTVLALGGGAFVQAANYELIENHGVSVWLDCPLDVLEARVQCATHRPLARDPKKFVELFEVRRAFYSRADFRIPVEGYDPAGAVDALLALPLFQ
jgi:shikimate kinase